jgi:hypothetical protein
MRIQISPGLVTSVAVLVISTGVLMQGCSSTATRASDKAASLNRLSPTDKQLALAGRIHNGFSKDAVYVAWGAPSKTAIRPTPQGPQECWTYVQTYNGYGGGYYGISRGEVHGTYGDHYDTNQFYPAPDTAQTAGGAATTEVPVKRVVFEKDRVISYETSDSQPAADEEN